jgi:hypothetical protein
MTPQIIIAAKNNIIAILFFKKTRQYYEMPLDEEQGLEAVTALPFTRLCLHRLSSHLECRIK